MNINPKDDKHPNHHDVAILFTRSTYIFALFLLLLLLLLMLLECLSLLLLMMSHIGDNNDDAVLVQMLIFAQKTEERLYEIGDRRSFSY